MKKVTNIKYLILGMLISGIMFGAGAYAATTYVISANKIEYLDNSNLGATNVQAAIDGTCTKFNNQLTDIRKSVYPVGSIYLSATLSTTEEVKDLLGGEWEVYGKGKTLVGVDSNDSDFETVDKTGGSKTRTISGKQIPSLTSTGTTTASTTGSTGSGYSIGYTYSTRTTSSTGAHTHTTIANQNMGLLGYANGSGIYRGRVQTTSSGGAITFLVNNQEGLIYYLATNTTSSAGAHTHTVSDYYANSITGVAAHTHSIPSLSVTANYQNNSQSSINIQNPYITVYMYKRIS